MKNHLYTYLRRNQAAFRRRGSCVDDFFEIWVSFLNSTRNIRLIYVYCLLISKKLLALYPEEVHRKRSALISIDISYIRNKVKGVISPHLPSCKGQADELRPKRELNWKITDKLGDIDFVWR